MTEDEMEMLEEAVQDFWNEWVLLVNIYRKRGKEHGDEFLFLLLTRMQEKATVYGALE